MKREYYDIYEMLYAEYAYENEFRRRRPFPFDEYYIIRTIRQSIDNADKDNSLRPDAKYFLMVNFHHLIVRPLFEQRPYREIRLEKEFIDLESDIKSDINTIVSETKEDINISESRPNEKKEEISGHKIMKTIDRVWKNLKTTKFEVWG